MKLEEARARVAKREQVVILGAGYAGLRAALGLAREPSVQVTLIDRDRAPAVKTRLHELRESAETTSVDRLLAQTDVRFLQATVSEVDRDSRKVVTDVGETLEYDHLIVALGSRASDRGVIGVREHAVMLDGAEDAERLSRSVRRLEQTAGQLIVVGAGPTGVEAAAEASRMLGRGRVTLVEGGQRILPGFPALPRAYARAVLAGLGVHVRRLTEVSQVAAGQVVLRDGSVLPYEALLWSAGVEGHPLVAESGLAPLRAQAPVDEYLLSKVDPNVYVVGDSADANGGRPSAQLAVQQGDFVAKDLLHRLRGEPRNAYLPSVVGEFISLGCDATGALYLGPIQLPLFGPPARAAKLAGETRHRLVVAAKTLTSRAMTFAKSRDPRHALARRTA